MADELIVPNGSIKRRDPWGTFLLSIVTLGIYRFVWYYMINREMRDHGRVDVKPARAVLAITLGAILVVPAVVSLYRTADRVRQVQGATGAQKRIEPWVALLIGFFTGFHLLDFYLPYVQSHLNSAWDVEFAAAGR